MNLYYMPGACSMASHLTIKELNLPIDVIRMDMATRTTERGDAYDTINPDGYVPALQFDDGSVMTESAAILQYLADSAGSTTMLPATGDVARYRVIELLSFISTEIHQKIGPLLPYNTDEAAKAAALDKINKRLVRLEGLLAAEPFLTGENFTIADAYAFAIFGALQHFKVPLDSFPNIGQFVGRVAGRPSTQAMLKAEGLIP